MKAGQRSYVRLVLDEPTNLPEGTIIELVADDQEDSLTKSWASVESGRVRQASEILDELRRRR